jgi:hypothetical protein
MHNNRNYQITEKTMNLKLLNYEPLPRHTGVDGKRVYNTPSGELASVTTILSATADKPALEAWRKWVGEKKADEIKIYASNLGSLVHTHLEKHILGEPRPRGTNTIRVLSESMANGIIANGLSKVEEVWGLEAPLYYPNLFAGTADLIGTMNGGIPTLMDFKTTKNLKKLEHIEDYGCQLASYAMAHNYLHGTNIEHGCIFMVSRDGIYQQFDFGPDEMKEYTYKWVERLELFYSV